MRAPRARRRRARALLGACWAWAREGGARRGVHRVASNSGPVGAGGAEELGRGAGRGPVAGRGGRVSGSGNGGGRRCWWGGFCNRGGKRGGVSRIALLVWDGDLKDIYPGWARDSPADFSGRAPSPALGDPTHARAQSAGTRSAAPAAGALQPWASPGERPRGARRSGRRPVPAPAPPAFSPGL